MKKVNLESIVFIVKKVQKLSSTLKLKTLNKNIIISKIFLELGFMLIEFFKGIKSAFTKVKTTKSLKLVVLISFGLVAIFILVRFIKNQPKNDSIPSVKIAPENLCLPEDPLVLPPIQFSREQEKSWSDEKIKEFFIIPSDDTIENLHNSNSKKIDNLLEGIK